MEQRPSRRGTTGGAPLVGHWLQQQAWRVACCLLLLASSAPAAVAALEPHGDSSRRGLKEQSVSTSGAVPAVTTDFVLFNGFLVFFMQVGFVSIEAGTGRAKNVKNIMLKNIINIMLCAICWWAAGYAFAYGKDAGGFIGVSQFFTDGGGSGEYTRPWFFTWTFALSTVTITSGCLAERTHLFAYPVYTTVTALLVHPVVAHWVWAPGGWLQTVSDCPFLDFAGGSVVHGVGGLMGLVGALLVGPRLGRFEEGVRKEMPGHDVSSVSIGALMIWFGWFGFNCGSTYLYMQGGQDPSATSEAVSRVALNMTLCASTSGLAVLLTTSLVSGTFDLTLCYNGLLAGLSASTSNSGFVAPWAACVTGLLVGLGYEGSRRLLVVLGVDDPLDSSAVHAGSGLLGCLISGFLAKPSYVRQLTGHQCGGVVYGDNGGTQLGMQLLGVCVTSAWTLAWSLAIFLVLRRLQLLRVDQVTELAGIDNMEHGGPAYPEFTPCQPSASRGGGDQ